jgi:hypothetical protein
MKRTLIQQYATSIIKGFYEKIKSLDRLDHKLTKGELREFFVVEVLNQFLTDQFGVGSGIIINQAGKQSFQNDIIIFDKRVLPPFVKHMNLGVFPIESVLGVLEVKSRLTRKAILDTEGNFKYLKSVICDKKYSLYKNDYNPLCGMIGFFGNGCKELYNDNGNHWLLQNIKNMFSICLVGKYTWLKPRNLDWSKCNHDKLTFEETKRFIAVFIDNIRTRSTSEPYVLKDFHKDWLSIYIRDQEWIKNKLKIN